MVAWLIYYSTDGMWFMDINFYHFYVDKKDLRETFSFESAVVLILVSFLWGLQGEIHFPLVKVLSFVVDSCNSCFLFLMINHRRQNIYGWYSKKLFIELIDRIFVEDSRVNFACNSEDNSGYIYSNFSSF